MKLGTKSLLYGAHQFALHPLFVLAGWVRLYGLRSLNWQVLLAIIIHDWGYWGCVTMDGPDGSYHPLRITYPLWFFNLLPNYTLFLVWRHSRHLCKERKRKPSRLCWADKLAVAIMPSWLWATLAYWSGEGLEYHVNPYGHDYVSVDEPYSFSLLIRFHQRYKQEWSYGSPMYPMFSGN